MGHAVTWNDIRSELSDYVKLKAENSKIEFMPGNILQQDGKAEFDAVAAFEVIEHTAHPDQFLKHLTSFIKPGGYLILSTPNGAYCRNNLPCFSDTANKEQFETKQFKPNADGHIFLLWPSELEALAKQCNLNPVMLKTFGTPLSCGHCGIHYLHKFIPHCVLNIVEKATHIFPPFIRNFLSYGLVAVFKKEEYHVA